MSQIWWACLSSAFPAPTRQPRPHCAPSGLGVKAASYLLIFGGLTVLCLAIHFFLSICNSPCSISFINWHGPVFSHGPWLIQQLLSEGSKFNLFDSRSHTLKTTLYWQLNHGDFSELQLQSSDVSPRTNGEGFVFTVHSHELTLQGHQLKDQNGAERVHF